MSSPKNVKLWYFTGMLGDRVVHIDHDVFSSINGRDVAEERAQEWFNQGVNIDGEIVEFDRVVAISEDHEIALDIRRGTKD